MEMLMAREENALVVKETERNTLDIDNQHQKQLISLYICRSKLVFVFVYTQKRKTLLKFFVYSIKDFSSQLTVFFRLSTC